MRLRRVHIDALPGIHRPFEIENEENGLWILAGANGSGKSSVGRAIRAVLWPDQDPDVRVRVDFERRSASGETEEVIGHRHGRSTEWRCNGAPMSAPFEIDPIFSSCFHVRRDDLIADEETNAPLAARLHRELAGGFDLEQVVARDSFKSKPRRIRNAHDALRKTRRNVDVLRADVDRISNEERRLESLRSNIEAIDALFEKRARIEKQLEREKQQSELREVKRELEALPDGVGAVTQNAAEEARETEETLTELKRRSSQRQRELAAAKEVLTSTESVADIDTRAIDEARSIVEGWREADRQRIEWSAERDGQRAIVGDWTLPTGFDAAPANGAGRPATEPLAVDHALTSWFEANAQQRVLESRLEELQSEVDQFDAEGDATELRKAAVRLRQLELQGDRPSIFAPRELFIAFLVAAAVTMVIVLLKAGALVAIAGAVAAAVVSIVGRSILESNRGKKISDEDRKLIASVLPDEASDADLAATIQTLEATAKKLDLQGWLKDVQRDWKSQLSLHRSTAEKRRADFEEAIGDIARAANIDPDGDPTVAMRGTLSTASRWFAAQTEIDRLDGEIEAIDQMVNSHRERVASLLKCAPPLDAAAANAALLQAESGTRDRQNAVEQIMRVEEQLRELTMDIEAKEADWKHCFLRCDLDVGDHSGLETLVACRPRFDGLENDRRRLTARISDLDEQLGEAEPSTDPLDFERELERVDAQLGNRDKLIEQRAQIERHLEEAKTSDQLAQGLDAMQRARHELDQAVDAERLAAIGQSLVDAIRTEERSQSTPFVLERAAGLFQRFTKRRFSFELGPKDRGEELRARDARGRLLPLSQLSSGTRSQLLLAIRIAIADDLGPSIPLFLDEVFESSDDERRDEIGAAIAELVSRGDRTILFATCSADDVEFWNQRADGDDVGCQITDVGAARDLPPLPLEISRAARTEVTLESPKPGEAIEEYARRVGHSPSDPREPAGTWPLANVVEDPNTLHSALSLGLEIVGQLDGLVADGDGGLLPGPLAQQLTTANSLARAWHSAWSIGRGKPLHRRHLDESQLVTERYLDDFEEILRENGRSAEALLGVIDSKSDERARGFRSAKREELEEWLEQHGYVDRRPKLDSGGAIRFVAERTSVDAGSCAPTVRRLWHIAEALSSDASHVEKP